VTGKFPSWPAWYYGPNGEARIFNEGDIVPKGWKDSPKKLAQSEQPAQPEKLKPEKPKKGAKQEVTQEQLDRINTIAELREAGVEIADDATDDEINAAIDTLTEHETE
jgi:hypothetical protein